MSRAFRFSLMVAMFLVAVRAHAEDNVASPVRPVPPPGIEKISAIGQELRMLGDWDEMYEMAAPGIDSFWESRGWNDEADLFALETLHEVAAIPPWEFSNRLNHMMGAVGERYDLSDEQYRNMQGKVYGLVGAMAWRHGGTVLKQAHEAVQTRLHHEPFTAEQIARWTKDTDTLFHEMRSQVDRIASEIRETLTPEQQEIFDRDSKSYIRRMQAIEELRDQWAKGEWHPEDWALQNDPVHRPLVEKLAAERRREASIREMSVPYAPLNETTWSRYVRWFITYYQLDNAQATAALSILHECEARAADYRRLHHEELLGVPMAQRDGDPAYAPIHKLFDELKRRLHPIPTLTQRHRADAPPPEDSDDSAIDQLDEPLEVNTPPE